MDDRALVAAAQAGDRRALDALLRRHHDRIAAVCRRLTSNAADAQDATQDALIAIVRGLPRFDGRARFTTWSYRVATNACLDELRRRARRPEPGLGDEHGDRWPEPATRAAALEGVDDRIDIEEALGTLPLEMRAAVVLRDVCDLDYAEIAEVLAIPPGTVRSRIARGRARLARLLYPGNQGPSARRPTDGTKSGRRLDTGTAP